MCTYQRKLEVRSHTIVAMAKQYALQIMDVYLYTWGPKGYVVLRVHGLLTTLYQQTQEMPFIPTKSHTCMSTSWPLGNVLDG